MSDTITISKEALDERDKLIEEMIAESMAFERIVDADDKLKEAVATIKQLIAENTALKSQMAGKDNKCNELIRLNKTKDKRIAAQDKEIQKLMLAQSPL